VLAFAANAGVATVAVATWTPAEFLTCAFDWVATAAPPPEFLKTPLTATVPPTATEAGLTLGNPLQFKAGSAAAIEKLAPLEKLLAPAACWRTDKLSAMRYA
jgi:hypothetical protein